MSSACIAVRALVFISANVLVLKYFSSVLVLVLKSKIILVLI